MNAKLPPIEADDTSDARAILEVPVRIVDVGIGALPVKSTRELGGRRDGTDPTRFGDWEKGGRCIDF